MYPCPSCSNELPDSADFCSRCLRPVTGGAAPAGGTRPGGDDPDAERGPGFEPGYAFPPSWEEAPPPPLPYGPPTADPPGPGYPPPGPGYPPPEPAFGAPGFGPPGSGYGYPPASRGYGGWGPVVARTNPMAGWSLGCSIVGLFCCGVSSIVGVVLGALALRQITESGGTEGGRGLAIGGIVIGAVGILTGIGLAMALLSGSVANAT